MLFFGKQGITFENFEQTFFFQQFSTMFHKISNILNSLHAHRYIEACIDMYKFSAKYHYATEYFDLQLTQTLTHFKFDEKNKKMMKVR